MKLLTRTNLIISLILGTLCVFAPLVWWVVNGATKSNFSTLVQLNGIATLATLATIAALLLRACKHSKEQTCIVAGMAFVSAFLLAVVNNAGGHPNFDYQCVQNAAVNIVQGKNPYGEATGYVLYPPMYAGSMHAAYKAALAISRIFHWHPDMTQAFNVIFYLFQNTQSLAVVALLWLSAKFTYVAGKLTGAFQQANGKLHAAALACVVIGLNWPVYGTIQWNQVNIYITCMVLFALTFVNAQHVARGFAVALGIHLKAYPGLLIPALLLSKEWKASAYAVVFTTVLALITTADFGTGIWKTYLTTAHAFIDQIMLNPPTYMVDGSNVWSVVFSASRFIALSSNVKHSFDAATISAIANGIKLAAGAWFAWRLLKRQLNQRTKKAVSPTALLYDNASDFLSFGLLAGPTTLNHHYVLAIPIVLWTIVRSGTQMPMRVLLGCVMISNFQSHMASLMTLAPLGLLILASARSTKSAAPAVEPESAATETQNGTELLVAASVK